MNFRFIEIEEPSTDDEETYNKLICKETMKAYVKTMIDIINKDNYTDSEESIENAIISCVNYLCGVTIDFKSLYTIKRMKVGEYSTLLKMAFRIFKQSVKHRLKDDLLSIIKYYYTDLTSNCEMENVERLATQYKLCYDAYKRRFYQ